MELFGPKRPVRENGLLGLAYLGGPAAVMNLGCDESLNGATEAVVTFKRWGLLCLKLFKEELNADQSLFAFDLPTQSIPAKQLRNSRT